MKKQRGRRNSCGTIFIR